MFLFTYYSLPTTTPNQLATCYSCNELAILVALLNWPGWELAGVVGEAWQVQDEGVASVEEV